MAASFKTLVSFEYLARKFNRRQAHHKLVERFDARRSMKGREAEKPERHIFFQKMWAASVTYFRKKKKRDKVVLHFLKEKTFQATLGTLSRYTLKAFQARFQK